MNSGNALLLLMAVLLPLIPAYILYRLLPSQADLEGPWKGMKLKMSGAFAGYFVLMISLFGFSSRLPNYEVWTVEGTMAFSDGAGSFDERVVRFTLEPPGVRVFPDGSFRLTLLTSPQTSGIPELPTFIVDHEGYVPVTVNLERRRGDKQRLKRRLVLNDTLVLKRDPYATHEQ